MNKKVLIWKPISMLLCVILIGLSFTSCEDENDDKITASIVGTWEWEDTETEDGETIVYLQRYTFKKDNTGSYYTKMTFISYDGAKEENMSFEENENFTYIYDSEDDDLILNFKEIGTYREYEVKGISEKELMLESEDGAVYYFEKKK